MKKLNIALVAHDARKQELVKWCTFNSSILKHHNLFATGTTVVSLQVFQLIRRIVHIHSKTSNCLSQDLWAVISR